MARSAKRGRTPNTSTDDAGRGDTRARILDAARLLAQRDGLAAVTVGAVAAEADVFKAAVGYHFGSKAGLLASLVTATFDEIEERIAAAARTCPPGPKRVRFIVEQWLAFSQPEDDLAFFDVLGYVLRHEELHEQLKDFYQRWTDLVLELLLEDSDIDEGDARELALLLRMLIDGMTIERLVYPDRDGWMDAGKGFEQLAAMYAAAAEHTGTRP